MVPTRQTASKSDTPVKSYGLRKFQQYTEGYRPKHPSQPFGTSQPSMPTQPQRIPIKRRARTFIAKNSRPNISQANTRTEPAPPTQPQWRPSNSRANLPPSQNFSSVPSHPPCTTDPKFWVGFSPWLHRATFHRPKVLGRSYLLHRPKALGRGSLLRRPRVLGRVPFHHRAKCLARGPPAFPCQLHRTKLLVRSSPSLARLPPPNQCLGSILPFWLVRHIAATARIHSNSKIKQFYTQQQPNKLFSTSPTTSPTQVHPQSFNKSKFMS